jgi:hypothetical protein
MRTNSIEYARVVSEKLIKEAWAEVNLVLPEGKGK